MTTPKQQELKPCDPSIDAIRSLENSAFEALEESGKGATATVDAETLKLVCGYARNKHPDRLRGTYYVSATPEQEPSPDNAALVEVKVRLDQAYDGGEPYFRARINSLRSYVEAALASAPSRESVLDHLDAVLTVADEAYRNHGTVFDTSETEILQAARTFEQKVRSLSNTSKDQDNG